MEETERQVANSSRDFTAIAPAASPSLNTPRAKPTNTAGGKEKSATAKATPTKSRKTPNKGKVLEPTKSGDEVTAREASLDFNKLLDKTCGLDGRETETLLLYCSATVVVKTPVELLLGKCIRRGWFFVWFFV